MVLSLLHADDGVPVRQRRELRRQAVQAVGQHQSLLERAYILRPCPALVLGVIALPDAVPGRQNAVGQIAVVCQQQKPLRILVKPADGHNAESPVFVRHKFHDGLCLRIVGGGQIACGLVEHDEDRPAQTHGLAVHRNAGGCFVKFPALVGHDRAVCGYAARADDRAQLLPAGDARLTQNSVQSLHMAAPVINKIGLHRLYHAIK